MLKEQLSELFTQQKLAESQVRANMADVDRALTQVAKDGTFPTDLPSTPIFRALFQPNSSRFLRGFYTTDPLPLARAYPGPVLLVTGEYDMDASPEKDTIPLETAFKSSQNDKVNVVIVPHGSHAIKESPDRKHEVFAGPVIPAAMDQIVGWAKTQL